MRRLLYRRLLTGIWTALLVLVLPGCSLQQTDRAKAVAGFAAQNQLQRAVLIQRDVEDTTVALEDASAVIRAKFVLFNADERAAWRRAQSIGRNLVDEAVAIGAQGGEVSTFQIQSLMMRARALYQPVKASYEAHRAAFSAEEQAILDTADGSLLALWTLGTVTMDTATARETMENAAKILKVAVGIVL